MRLKALLTVPLLFAVLTTSACTGTTGAEPTTSDDAAPPSPVQAEVYTPIVLDALTTPTPIPASDGTTRLHYEYVLRNMVDSVVTLDTLAILDESGAELVSYAADELAARTMIVGSSAPTATIGNGGQVMTLIDVVLDDDAPVPASVTPVLAFSVETPVEPLTRPQMVETGPSLTVSGKEPITIAAPVAGDNWFWPNGCCENTPHTNSALPINNEFTLSERFALDLVQIDADGHLFQGARDDTASYGFYGAEVLAVADGPVVAILTDVPTGTPGVTPNDLELGEYAGNYVIQDVGNGTYAMYAHLEPGNPNGMSIGQQLTKGEPIGRLGTSGHSDLPHLHFQLMDAPNPLLSSGVPFVFERLTQQGTIDFATGDACFNEGGVCGVVPEPVGERAGRFPLIYGVYSFD